MARLAKRLPVALIPEQRLIAPMRDDVVDHGRRDDRPALQTFLAQRMPAQDAVTGRAPFTAVAPAMGIFSCVQAAMRFAVHPVRQVRAAGMAAGTPGFSGHFLTSLRCVGCVFPSGVVGSWARRDCMQSYVTGEIIRGLREKRRLTQRDLAQRLNVSDKTVSKWETGVSQS